MTRRSVRDVQFELRGARNLTGAEAAKRSKEARCARYLLDSLPLSSSVRPDPTHTIMNALRSAVPVVACGLALGPKCVPAQARTTIAVDATVGAGFGRGGEFSDRGLSSARIAASLRRSSPTRFGFFGELAIDAPSIHLSDRPVVCYLSGGGCLGSYPELLGLTVTGGLIAQRTNRIEARLGVGGGAFIADPTGLRGTRVGAVLSQADVALFPITHIGVIAGGRWVVVPRYHGDRLTVFPWTLGLRFR